MLPTWDTVLMYETVKSSWSAIEVDFDSQADYIPYGNYEATP